jgi:hypothetical protein
LYSIYGTHFYFSLLHILIRNALKNKRVHAAAAAKNSWTLKEEQSKGVRKNGKL